jgi:hypothetical protein
MIALKMSCCNVDNVRVGYEDTTLLLVSGGVRGKKEVRSL